jgi:hypothetical protein
VEGILVEEEEQVEDLWPERAGWYKTFVRPFAGALRFFFLVIVLTFCGALTFYGLGHIFGGMVQAQASKSALFVLGFFGLLHLLIPFFHENLKTAFLAIGSAGFASLLVVNIWAKDPNNSWFVHYVFALIHYYILQKITRWGVASLLVGHRDLQKWGERGLSSLDMVLRAKNLPTVEQIYRKEDALRLVLFYPTADTHRQGHLDAHFVSTIDEVGFQCNLPLASTGKGELLSLKPQRGVEGRVKSLGDLKVGHAALDALYVIRGAKGGASENLLMVKSIQRPLRALADLEAMIEIQDTTITIQIPPVHMRHLDWSRLLNQISALWQGVDRYRSGFDMADGPTDETDQWTILTGRERRLFRGRHVIINPVLGFLGIWLVAMALGACLACMEEAERERLFSHDAIPWML